MSNLRRFQNRRNHGGPPAEPPSISGRVPRHDLDAEAAVLSAILLDQGAMDLVQEVLGEGQAFYSDANRRIYEAAADLSQEGKPIDIVTVAAWLRVREWMGQIGGPRYLAQLADATPAVAHVAEHARIVKELSRQRQVVALCQRIAAEGYGDVGPVQGWLDQCEQELYNLARDDTKKQARTLGTVLKRTFADLSARAEQGRKLAGVSTGYPDLDRKIAGYQRGKLYLLAGRPGHCKSTLMLNSLIRVAEPRTLRVQDPEDEHGRRTMDVPDERTGVALFSLEMQEDEVGLRSICAEARVDNERAANNELLADDWRRMVDVAPHLNSLPVYIDDSSTLSLLDLRAKIRRIQAEYDRPATDTFPGQYLAVAAVDYAQLLTGREGASNRDQELAEISKGLKRLAKELNIAVIALSSMNRDIDKRSGKQQEPRLSDLRECGSLEFDADTVMFIWVYEVADETNQPGIAKVTIAKQRGGGSTGTIYLHVNRKQLRIESLDRHSWPGADE